MKIQHLSCSGSNNYGANLRGANLANIKRAQKYLERTTLVAGFLTATNSAYGVDWSQKYHSGVPSWYEKHEYTGLKKLFKLICGQPTHYYTDTSNARDYVKVEHTGIQKLWDTIIGNKPFHYIKKSEKLETLYDIETVRRVLDNWEQNGVLDIEQNTVEALQFAIFQEDFMVANGITEPIIPYENLIDTEIFEQLKAHLPSMFKEEQLPLIIERLCNIVDSLGEE